MYVTTAVTTVECRHLDPVNTKKDPCGLFEIANSAGSVDKGRLRRPRKSGTFRTIANDLNGTINSKKSYSMSLHIDCNVQSEYDYPQTE